MMKYSLFFLIPMTIMAVELPHVARARVDRLKVKYKAHIDSLYERELRSWYINDKTDSILRLMGEDIRGGYSESYRFKLGIYKKVQTICSDEELSEDIAGDIINEIESTMAEHAFNISELYVKNESLTDEDDSRICRQQATFKGSLAWYTHICFEEEWHDCEKNKAILRDLVVARCDVILNDPEEKNSELRRNVKKLAKAIYRI